MINTLDNVGGDLARISGIPGVNAKLVAASLLERGFIEEAGRSQYGAAMCRTTDPVMRLSGLSPLDEPPDVGTFDPSPELQEEPRERRLRAGEARAAG